MPDRHITPSSPLPVLAHLARLVVAVLAVAVLLVAVTSASARRVSTGVFDTACEFSHSLEDDPLVHPQHPGMSHLHDFFGNRLTDAHSTGKSLLDAGRADHDITTCQDASDWAAYWSPALYRDGEKLDPMQIHAYYRNAKPEDAAPFPIGFGVVAGDAGAEEPNPHVRWECSKAPHKPSNKEIPTCGRGEIQGVVKFPACWNGVDLFIPDQSHVKYGVCGASHPVRLPEITLVIKYPNDRKDHEYRLASGSPMTLHADFFNAWDPVVLALLVAKCNNETDENGFRRNCNHNEVYPPDCRDFVDNDSDAKRDYSDDPNCSSRDDSTEWEATKAECRNGKDDDGDGKTDDRQDPGCSHDDDDSERDVDMPQCSDGIDNDGDGKIDYPADARCSGRPDNDEGRRS